MTWKYTDNTNLIVFRANPDGSMESCLASVLTDGTEILPTDPVPNPRIAELKAELAALDIKRIRPTAEGDTAYLTILNDQAVTLRAELKAL